MAEEVILQRDGANNEENKPQKNNIEENEHSFEEVKKPNVFKDPKFLFVLFLMLGIMFFLLMVLYFLHSKTVEPFSVFTPQDDTSQEVVVDRESVKFEMTKIDDMIQKANALYLRGEREQAVKIYEQISIYSEALSNYNLGVSQMEQKNYTLALESFKKSIAANENQTVSAINAAVCALHLNDKLKFDYYIDLAYVYLSNEGDSELFDYYLSLINYYKGLYPEALQMLQQTQNKAYEDDAKYLSAKIYAKMGLNSKALENLTAQGNYNTFLSEGLLYARMGLYDKAKASLLNAQKIERDHNQSLAALNLIDIKTGHYREMLDRTNKEFEGNENYILDFYKIKVRLNNELSDINIAQQNFSKDFIQDLKAQANLLFYFTPYQVFDVKQAASYINKANVSNFIQDRDATNEFLSTSKVLSSVNVKLSKIINQALDGGLYKANEGFKDLLKSYKQHSILQFNLALSYAQMQYYDLAYKHFSTSYHLDPRNYAAGSLAVLSGVLAEQDTTKLVAEINENINLDNEFKDKIYQNVILFARKDFAAMLPFLDEADNNGFALVLKIIIAKNNDLNNEFNERIMDLKDKFKDDLLVDILFFNATNYNLNIKEYAQNAQIYFKNLNFDYDKLANAPVILRDSYITMMRISGLLNQERERIKQKLASEDGHEIGLSLILAYMDIYAGLFEEAYGLYSVLIDDYKIKDSNTYFLAAVAAVGANNPNAAIALLELSKLEDNSNQDARLALALLYHSVQNYEPAIYQYSQVKDGFLSKFFTFDLARN